MVQAQIINQVLSKKDYSIILNNNLTNDYFVGYTEELNFIKEHIDKYGSVPDIETFIQKFPEFELFNVTESDKYLIDTIREENLYSRSVPVLKKMAEILKSDANAAAQYMLSEIPNLQPNYDTQSVDVLHDTSRVDEFLERHNNKDKWEIPTGFEELDNLIGGWDVSEEFAVLFARTNNGKTWVLLQCVKHAAIIGKNVGVISPEMSPNKLAYRIDTLDKHFSNRALMKGDTDTVNFDEYKNYVTSLGEKKNKLLVSTPKDFNKVITVGKLRNFIQSNKLELLAIDGITYITDERYKKGDSKTTSLTNISEDLIQLSSELHVPIIIVVQSNRNGVKEDANSTPEIEDIRDSDGIAQNATKVLSIKQKESSLVLVVKKARYAKVGDKLTYLWDIDRGELTWLANEDDAAPEEQKQERKREIKEQYEPAGKVVF